ncbi:hypothetical protein [Halomonas sp. A29]|uniref:hypothetical protein n=1 Tax=Halomonas sp. A29 TaxID=3102786 RepID=UPI00398AF74C
MPSSAPRNAWPIGFTAASLRAGLYVLFIAGCGQLAYLEAAYFPQSRFTEYGLVELAQSLVLATSAALLFYVRQVQRALPTVTLLMFAFIASSLIREQDYWLDTRVARHAWKVLVALIVLPALALVIRRRHRFADEFRHYSNTFSFGLFASGVLVTYVFSRLFGRQSLWQAIMQESYLRSFKNAAEEMVELLGYALILIAIIELVLLARRWCMARH